MHNTRQHTTGTAAEEQSKIYQLTAVEITKILEDSIKKITESTLYDGDIKEEYMKVDEATLTILTEDVKKRLDTLTVKDTESLYANVYSEIVFHVPNNFPSISSQALTLLLMKFADFFAQRLFHSGAFFSFAVVNNRSCIAVASYFKINT